MLTVISKNFMDFFILSMFVFFVVVIHLVPINDRSQLLTQDVYLNIVRDLCKAVCFNDFKIEINKKIQMYPFAFIFVTM